MTAELLHGSRAVEADTPLSLVCRDGERPAATTPEVAPLGASETAVAEEEPRQPLYTSLPRPPQPGVYSYDRQSGALEAILKQAAAGELPIRAEPQTEPFEREFHCWEDDESRRLEVDTNSPRYIVRLLNLYRQRLFEPTEASLYWGKKGRPSLVSLAGYPKTPLNLRGWKRRLDGRANG